MDRHQSSRSRGIDQIISKVSQFARQNYGNAAPRDGLREEGVVPWHLDTERREWARLLLSGLALCRNRANARRQCPLSGATRKTYARTEFFSV
jgi:hypothetical protein